MLSYTTSQYRVYEFAKAQDAKEFASKFGGSIPFGFVGSFRVYTVII